ncbi:MAG TPA: hypothetical protein VMT85_21865 [Thermoanaerobaculia bacterium]|nr:hypothetical protein [Thermoanaerobaculia bacterium]
MSADESARFWDELEASWRGGETARADSTTAIDELGARVRRQSRSLRLVALSETLVSVAFLAVAARMVAAPGAGLFEWITAIGIALVVAIAGAFALVNRRGMWRSVAQTPEAYLDLLRRRSAARLRSLRFGGWLLLTETLAFCAWIPFAVDAGNDVLGRLLFGYAFLAAWSGGALILVLVLRRRAVAERAALEQLASDQR